MNKGKKCPCLNMSLLCMKEVQLLPDYLNKLQEHDPSAKYHLLLKDGAPQVGPVLVAAGAEEELSSFHGLYVCLSTTNGELP